MTDNVNSAARISDPVSHPSHYAEGWSNGAEVIDITENLNFNRGNAVKYIARAGKKDPEKELEDLQKAKFYLDREIDRWHNPPSYVVVPDAPTFNLTLDNTPEPRVWKSLRDVPKDLPVSGIDESPYNWPWPWYGVGPDGGDDYDEYGPFTEILEGS
jgi:hypothetical protein